MVVNEKKKNLQYKIIFGSVSKSRFGCFSLKAQEEESLIMGLCYIHNQFTGVVSAAENFGGGVVWGEVYFFIFMSIFISRCSRKLKRERERESEVSLRLLR